MDVRNADKVEGEVGDEAGYMAKVARCGVCERGVIFSGDSFASTVRCVANVYMLMPAGVSGEMFATIERALDERTIGHNPERLNLMKVGKSDGVGGARTRDLGNLPSSKWPLQQCASQRLWATGSEQQDVQVVLKSTLHLRSPELKFWAWAGLDCLLSAGPPPVPNLVPAKC